LASYIVILRQKTEFDLIWYVDERSLHSLRQWLLIYISLIDRLEIVWN